MKPIPVEVEYLREAIRIQSVDEVKRLLETVDPNVLDYEDKTAFREAWMTGNNEIIMMVLHRMTKEGLHQKDLNGISDFCWFLSNYSVDYQLGYQAKQLLRTRLEIDSYATNTATKPSKLGEWLFDIETYSSSNVPFPSPREDIVIIVDYEKCKE